MSDSHGVVQVVMTPGELEVYKRWLTGNSGYLFQIPASTCKVEECRCPGHDDLPAFCIGFSIPEQGKGRDSNGDDRSGPAGNGPGAGDSRG
jgi:hypothetical protein